MTKSRLVLSCQLYAIHVIAITKRELQIAVIIVKLLIHINKM